MQRLPFSLAIGLAFVSLSVRGDDSQQRPEGPSFPAGTEQLYDALSTSMTTEHMPGFMKLFHISFVYEGEDRASLDRGPWRRLWLERFTDRSYEVVSSSPGQTVEESGERIVLRVEEVTVFDDATEGTKWLEKVFFEDTLVRESGTWQLLQRIRKSSNVGQVAPPTEMRSPCLAALAASLKAGEQASLAAFWARVETEGTPLVEPDLEASLQQTKHSLITFLWRGGHGERRVRVTNVGSSGGELAPLERLGESDIWYRTISLRNDARFRYEFDVERAVAVPDSAGGGEVFTVTATRKDPLNKKTVDEASLAALQAAPPLSRLEPVSERPEGTLERETLRSKTLRERRFVSVYRPPAYDETGAPYPAVFLLDGGTYGSRRFTRVLLDNLIAEAKIPPLVAFLLHSEGSRRPDLEATSLFVDFLGGELVEWARKSCHISQQPADVVIGGNKLGAALATLCASRRPDVFSAVLAESGDFSVCVDPIAGGQTGCLPQRFSEIPKQDLKFYLAVAELESGPLVSSAWHLRDVLAARGYSTQLVRMQRNHHSTTWLEALERGLIELLGEK